MTMKRDAPVSTAERMNHKSAVSYEARTREYPPGTVGAMSKQLFVNTQVIQMNSQNFGLVQFTNCHQHKIAKMGNFFLTTLIKSAPLKYILPILPILCGCENT